MADEEIRQVFALWRQKRGPDQARPLGERQDIIADKALQEGQGILAPQIDDPAFISHSRSPCPQI